MDDPITVILGASDYLTQNSDMIVCIIGVLVVWGLAFLGISMMKD